MSLLCLILSDDLLDASRIAGEGRSVGVDVVQCRDATALLAAAERQPVLALLDLHNPGLDLAAALESLKARGTRVIGFGSHVDAAQLKAARGRRVATRFCREAHSFPIWPRK